MSQAVAFSYDFRTCEESHDSDGKKGWQVKAWAQLWFRLLFHEYLCFMKVNCHMYTLPFSLLKSIYVRTYVCMYVYMYVCVCMYVRQGLQ